MAEAQPAPSSSVPPGHRIIYQGQPLPAFYAAEMLREYIGRSIYVRDSGGRTRQGELKEVPNVREDSEAQAPAQFADERPLYLRGIVCIALYEPPK